MGQFGTAKGVFEFFILVGWLVAALGVVLFVYVLVVSGIDKIVALSCCLIFVSGIFTVAAGQMGLAQIATAENTAAILAALTENNPNSAPVEAPTPTVARTTHDTKRDVSNLIKTYKGYEIIRYHSGVTVSGMKFGGVLDAEKWIDSKTN
jgi:hypothetical protein